jgi:hypothetical protein
VYSTGSGTSPPFDPRLYSVAVLPHSEQETGARSDVSQKKETSTSVTSLWVYCSLRRLRHSPQRSEAPRALALRPGSDLCSRRCSTRIRPCNLCSVNGQTDRTSEVGKAYNPLFGSCRSPQVDITRGVSGVGGRNPALSGQRDRHLTKRTRRGFGTIRDKKRFNANLHKNGSDGSSVRFETKRSTPHRCLAISTTDLLLHSLVL